MILLALSFTPGTNDNLLCRNHQSMLENRPKPIITAIKAIILHTFGVQVRAWGLQLWDPPFWFADACSKISAYVSIQLNRRFQAGVPE